MAAGVEEGVEDEGDGADTGGACSFEGSGNADGKVVDVEEEVGGVGVVVVVEEEEEEEEVIGSSERVGRGFLEEIDEEAVAEVEGGRGVALARAKKLEEEALPGGGFMRER